MAGPSLQANARSVVVVNAAPPLCLNRHANSVGVGHEQHRPRPWGFVGWQGVYQILRRSRPPSHRGAKPDQIARRRRGRHQAGAGSANGPSRAGRTLLRWRRHHRGRRDQGFRGRDSLWDGNWTKSPRAVTTICAPGHGRCHPSGRARRDRPCPAQRAQIRRSASSPRCGPDGWTS